MPEESMCIGIDTVILIIILILPLTWQAGRGRGSEVIERWSA